MFVLNNKDRKPLFVFSLSMSGHNKVAARAEKLDKQ